MDKGELTRTVNSVVIALCADYFRRAHIMSKGTASRRVDTEYRYYNFKMFDGAAEVVGEELAEVYIREIGERRGYANSAVPEICEVSYKRIKKAVKEAIARKLYLIE